MNIKKLLEKTLTEENISIYCDDMESRLYYYTKDLGLNISLKSQSLNTIDVVFSYEDKVGYRDKKHELVYTLSMNEIDEYLKKVIETYQINKIKNTLFEDEQTALFYVDELFKYFATEPTQKTYESKMEDNDLILLEGKRSHIIRLNRVIEEIKDNIYKNPLAMINIPCVFKKDDGKTIYFELAIPSYQMSKYPIINEHFKVNHYNINENDFLERLKNIPQSTLQSKVRNYLLDISLEKKDYTKSVKKL